ncbi:MAG: DUF1887 family protein, partial [Actinobacteria bacterium]|nr:DUF1887 family protein [Actinomycetota bacterium]
SLTDINRQLEKGKYQDDDKFWVNVTGGTKLMSLGVFNFFRNLASEIFYVPIGTNVYWKIFPQVKNKKRKIKANLGLQEYLTGYGISITNGEKIDQLTRPVADTLAFYRSFRAFEKPDFAVISTLRTWRNKKKKVPLDSNAANVLLKRWKFKPKNESFLTREEIDYLTGSWFEEYVYNWMKDFLNLKEREIGVGVKIMRESVQNEFDVLFVYHNTMYMIECKTGLWDSTADRNILNETIYKLEALRNDFGLRVKPYIFTLTERGDERFQVKRTNIERARHFGIEIVDGTTLKEPVERAKIIRTIKE